jgi:energy-coupling factor transport system permease protein
MGEATRCRLRPAGRLAVARSALSGALDRSVDLAAALELRGYALGGRPERRHVPWSRHDIRIAAAGVGIVLLAIGGRIAGIAEVEAYPELWIELGPAELALAGAIVALAAAPFAGRAARMGVARA